MNTEQHKQQANGGAETMEARRGIAPSVDIYENKQELLIVADLPGVNAADITINLEGNNLTIGGKRAGAPPGHALVVESKPYDFSRTFIVPQGIAGDQISAETSNGVLYVRLPKAVAQKPRQISVKAN